MTLQAEEIQFNWEIFLGNIETYITGDRKHKLLDFYKQYEERIILMPAAHKKEYHSAFPGGYVFHVNNVVKFALEQYELWGKSGADLSGFTKEELIFSAINHDLGKIGDENHEAYIPQTDQWRKDKLGEEYTYNTSLAFASVPDRGLYLLQSHGIQYSFNEMIAIQTHDGLYDDANIKYLKTFMPEQKPRTSLPYILHFADLMAARIEFEQQWLPKLGKSVEKTKKEFTLNDVNKKQSNLKNKALGSIKSENLKEFLNNL